MTTVRKKLIEVALPPEAINEEASLRKRKAPSGYPTTLHKWWAQRPLAAARAVIFAQMVDDPSAWPDLFPTEKKQEQERQRLFRIIEDLVTWENTTNEEVLQKARDEIWRSWRRACAENVGHPQAKELFDREKLPAFLDPFAGGGSLPLEAQRLGLESFAGDLNPVAILINKGLIEIPKLVGNQPPVSPLSKSKTTLIANDWSGAAGIVEDLRYYGRQVYERARKSTANLYPEIVVSPEHAAGRDELSPLIGKVLTPVAWLWARTVKSPNPAFREFDVPLASTFMLSTKSGKEVYVEPEVEGHSVKYAVRSGKPSSPTVGNGTKMGRGSNFACLLSGSPIDGEYIKEQALQGKLGAHLMAIVADSPRGRVYITPTAEQEEAALAASPVWRPELELAGKCRDQLPLYGMDTFGSVFTERQLASLSAISEEIRRVRTEIEDDAERAGMAKKKDYADGITTYLAFALSRAADYGSTLATWRPKDNAMCSSLPKQALQMTWDYAEGSPFASSSSGFLECIEVISKVLLVKNTGPTGHADQRDASEAPPGNRGGFVVSTDPPYYNNISYAELSDFFYVWLRRTLRNVFPDLLTTISAPKAEELIANPARHGGKKAAEEFFLEGMTRAMQRLAALSHPSYPLTIYYAFKQSETEGDAGTASTGWETFLEAVLRAGLTITGTWPMRTEGDNRQVGVGANALASSIVLVCRRHEDDAPRATRREFLQALEKELAAAVADLQRGNVAPVDLQQAAIGPGMAIFTRYSQVVDAEGQPVSVREALTLINQALDEVLAHQEGDFDSDTRWALAWFEQFGFVEADYGIAETLSKAKNTSVEGIRLAGIGTHGKGKVRLFKPEELPADWDPDDDKRLTVWDMVHHLIRTLEQGEEVAAALLAQLGTRADIARELAYRLYSICERKKRSADAQRYNALVQSWPELVRLAQQAPPKPQGPQPTLEGMN